MERSKIENGLRFDNRTTAERAVYKALPVNFSTDRNWTLHRAQAQLAVRGRRSIEIPKNTLLPWPFSCQLPIHPAPARAVLEPT